MKNFISNNKILILCVVFFTFIFASIGITITRVFNSRYVAKEITYQEDLDELEHAIKEIDSNVKNEITLEIGNELPNVSDYFEEDAESYSTADIKYYLNSSEVKLDEISNIKNKKRYANKLNHYDVIIFVLPENGKLSEIIEYNSVLNVVDKTAPVVKTKDVTITTGDAYTANSFIESYTDNDTNNNYSVIFKETKYDGITKVGKHNIILHICDPSNNCVDQTADLIVNKKKTNSSGGGGSSSSGGSGNNNSGGKEEQKVTFVKKITENVIIKKEEIKYGVAYVTTADITYNLYSDGSKKEVSRTNIKRYLHQGLFNGTVAQMKPEAKSLQSSLKGNQNLVLTATNNYREKEGVDPLTLDEDLCIMATIRAMEMAYSGVFAHKRPDGREWDTMWSDYYGSKPKGAYVGENLAYGYTGALDVSVAWKNSSGHYKNMVTEEFTKVGVGNYSFNGVMYWAQLFQS